MFAIILRMVSFQMVGVLNITPDSFSDGGLFLDENRACEQIEHLILSGADLIDIGAASSRPGSDFVDPATEISRLKGVLEFYFSRFSIPISLDTFHSEVAEFGLSKGVSWINDISGLGFDPRMAGVVSNYKAGVMLMHMKGNPKTMQISPHYEDVCADVMSFLKDRVNVAVSAGIKTIIVDPGIGFGKTVHHNLALISQISRFKELGYPVMMGPSRKQFIGDITGAAVADRLPGTIAACVLGLQNGVEYFRVHDVQAVKQALQVAEAILGADHA